MTLEAKAPALITTITPPRINLVKVQAFIPAATSSPDTFRRFIIAGFDLVPCCIALDFVNVTELRFVDAENAMEAIRQQVISMTPRALVSKCMKQRFATCARLASYMELGFKNPAVSYNFILQ